MPEQAQKESKAAVGYSLGGDHCHACMYFIEEDEPSETGTCQKVEGVIDGHYWCELFRRAAHAGAKEPEAEQSAAPVETNDVGKQASRMYARGLVSDKQMAKMTGE